VSLSATDRTAPGRLDPGFFERLFEGSGLAVFACAPSGAILAASSLGRGLLSEAGLGERSVAVADLIPDAYRAVLEESWQRCVTAQRPLEFRVTMERPGGASDYAVWLAPIFDGAGALEGVAVWFHDITDRVQLRRSLRKHERLSWLGSMCGAVAHHYNNQLCSIALSLEYAMNMNTTTAMRRALQRTAEAVARAARLTRQLLAFAQADHRACDLADLTEIVLLYFDEHEERLRERGITTQVQWQPLPAVPVPREQVVIILNNLVENAVEAMPAGGELGVALSLADEHTVCLSISDTGPGIRPEQMEHLFEPFYTTKGGEPEQGGPRRAGMGLAVVYGLVRDMQGTVSVHSTPGQGTRFDVLIPVPDPVSPALACDGSP
jgi:signal transduction histidine kinase